jgi:DNA-binding transcriptional MerR regulator
MAEGYASVSQVAKIFGISVSTVRKWFDGGVLEGIRLPDSGYRKITLSSVERLGHALRNEVERLTLAQLVSERSQPTPGAERE